MQFESSPSPDLFSNGESEVPGSRVSAPADWSAECKVRPREELAVESECPDVVDCNGEDSMGVVKCGGCGEAESEIRELRGKVQLLEKTLKEVLDSTRLGTQMTGLPRRHPGPRTSNCFKCGKSGHFRRECRTYVRRKEVLETIVLCLTVVPVEQLQIQRHRWAVHSPWKAGSFALCAG